MVNVSVARRYARALLEVASESSKLDAVGEQLQALVTLMSQHPELRTVMNDPAYSRAERQAVASDVMKLAQVTDESLVNLIHLLIDRSRMGSLPDIARAFRTLSDTRAGRIRGQVVTARPLAPDATQRIEQALEKLTQRNVVLETRVDPAVLGGVSTQVGSIVYDGTLRTQLEEMRKALR